MPNISSLIWNDAWINFDNYAGDRQSPAFTSMSCELRLKVSLFIRASYMIQIKSIMHQSHPPWKLWKVSIHCRARGWTFGSFSFSVSKGAFSCWSLLHHPLLALLCGVFCSDQLFLQHCCIESVSLGNHYLLVCRIELSFLCADDGGFSFGLVSQNIVANFIFRTWWIFSLISKVLPQISLRPIESVWPVERLPEKLWLLVVSRPWFNFFAFWDCPLTNGTSLMLDFPYLICELNIVGIRRRPRLQLLFFVKVKYPFSSRNSGEPACLYRF